MSLKAILISGGVAAGVAGIAFGGTAVSTAFSSEQTGNVAVQAKAVSLQTTGMDSMKIQNLAPGGSSSDTFTLTNVSSTTGALYLTNVGWGVSKNGSNGAAPDASKIRVSVTDAYNVVHFTAASLADLQGHPTLVANNIPANTPTDTITVTFALAQNAGNEWNGASVNVPFTLHLQDNQGADASTLG